MTNDEPLIFTTNGNVPVSTLAHSVAWDVRDDYIHFAEIYRDAAGVIVRQDAHVYNRQGAQLLTAAGPQE